MADMVTSGKRMSIGAKIFLVAASFSLPIAVLTYLVVININANIDFAAWEAKGDTYQRPLEKILQHIQQAQISTNSGVGDVGKSVAAATAAFSELEKADAAVGVDLQFTEEGLGKRNRLHIQLKTVKAEWTELATMLSKSGDKTAINEKSDHLASDIRTMIVHAGDTSNLILDPDLDSYYLMDVTLLALPQTQDRLAKITNYAHGLVSRGTISRDERVQLAVYASMIQEADHDRVVASTETALNEDPNFYGVLGTFQGIIKPALADYQAKNKAFIQLLRDIAANEEITTSPEAVAQSGIAARDSSFTYWHAAVGEMDKLLATRIAFYVQKRTTSLFWASVAVVVASAFAFYLTRTITKPLDSLVKYLQPGSDMLGVCSERISEASKAKFSDAQEAEFICNELNAQCNDMRKAVAELAAQVKGS